jgi:hypothetical protein
MNITNNIKKIESRIYEDITIPEVNIIMGYENIPKYIKEYIDNFPVTLYEYIVRDTYFPKDVESIIKEYIGYRLIQGHNNKWLFMVSYPNGIEMYNKNSIYNITDGFITPECMYKHNLHPRKLLIDGGINLNNKIE